jgi:hypothetical protein
LHPAQSSAGAVHALFWSHFYTNVIGLPRQARDKHRKCSGEKVFSAGACAKTVSSTPLQSRCIVDCLGWPSTLSRCETAFNLMLKQCAFVYNNEMSCCQDRVGTEKTYKKVDEKRARFSPSGCSMLLARRALVSPAEVQHDDSLFLLFRHLLRCCATRSLTKTGSGQTYEKATNESPFSVISQHQHQHQQHQGRLEWRHRRSLPG